MSRITLISAKKMIQLIKTLGFEESRQKGSHILFKHKDGRSALVPYHGNKDLKRGTMISILKDIEITANEYEELRKKL